MQEIEEIAGIAGRKLHVGGQPHDIEALHSGGS